MITSGSMAEAEVKNAAIKKARKVVMLMDLSKLDRSLPYTFATLDDIDTLVTNGPLPPELEEAIIRSNVTVI